MGGRVERSLTSIVDEAWRRRRTYCLIIHKGKRVKAKENDLYEHKERGRDSVYRLHMRVCTRTRARIHPRCVSLYKKKKKKICIEMHPKCILWNITSCTFLSWDTLANRGVCHLKVVWRGVNCFQTPASVWDYSSHSWLLGWAPKPILIRLYANCEGADLGTVATQVDVKPMHKCDKTSSHFSVIYNIHV